MEAKTYSDKEYLKALVNRVENYRISQEEYFKVKNNPVASEDAKKRKRTEMMQEKLKLDEAVLKIRKEIL